MRFAGRPEARSGALRIPDSSVNWNSIGPVSRTACRLFLNYARCPSSITLMQRSVSCINQLNYEGSELNHGRVGWRITLPDEID